MAVTRLQRKLKKNKVRSAQRTASIKKWLWKPVIKKTAIES